MSASTRGRDASPPGWLWWLLALPALVLFVSYQYNDNVVTTLHGMNVWQSLTEGQLRRFYSHNDRVQLSGPYFWPVGSQYGFCLYLVFALWNLPLEIARRAGVDVFASFPALLWAKSITLPFLALTIWAMRRLARALGLDSVHARWAALLFVSSGFVLQTVLVIGQYDLVHVWLVVLAVEAWVRGRWRILVALIAVATLFKWFPLLVFLPLLLLVEKRLWRVGVGTVLAALPALVVQLPFAGDPDRTVSGSSMIRGMLLSGSLPVGDGLAPVVAGYGLVLAACWLAPTLDARVRRTWGPFLAAAPTLVLFALSPSYPYWYVLVVPFLALTIVQRASRTNALLVVSVAWFAGMSVKQMIQNFNIWDDKLLGPMLLPRLLGRPEDLLHRKNLAAILAGRGLGDFLAAFSTITIVAPLLLVWLLSPWSRHGADDTAPAPLARNRGTIVVATTLCLGLCALPALTYLYQRFRYGLV